MCSTVNWWPLAWEPSRSDVSVTRTSRVSEYGMSGPPIEQVPSDGLADLGGGGGHDVEVAAVRRQVVARPLDLDERRDPTEAAPALVGRVELGVGGEPVAGDVG